MGWRGENSQRIQQGSCSVLLVYTAPWRRSQASKHPSSPSQSSTNILLWPQNLEIPQINRSLSKKKKDLLAQRLRESDKATRCCGQYRIAKDGCLSAKKNFTICARTHLDKYIYFFPKIRKKRGPSNVAQRANKNREALHILTLVFKFIWPVKRNKPLTLPKERTKTERFLYILTLVF